MFIDGKLIVYIIVVTISLGLPKSLCSGQALAINNNRFCCSSSRSPIKLSLQKKVLFPEDVSFPRTRLTVTFICSTFHFFLCTYMRKVIALHDASAAHK